MSSQRRMNIRLLCFLILNSLLTSLCFSSQISSSLLCFLKSKTPGIFVYICCLKFLAFHPLLTPLKSDFPPKQPWKSKVTNDSHLDNSIFSPQFPSYLACGQHLTKLITSFSSKHFTHLDYRSLHSPDVLSISVDALLSFYCTFILLSLTSLC